MLKHLLAGMLLMGAPLSGFLFAETANQLEFKGINARCRDNRCCDTRPQRIVPLTQTFEPAVAYFFLPPVADVDVNLFAPISGGDEVSWTADEFTIKSSSITIGEPVLADENNTDIVFKNPGIYLITYTFNGLPQVGEAPGPNSFTMELQLNGVSVAGSRYSASLPTSATDPLTYGAQELYGQVITYIPAGGHLALVNVSGFVVNQANPGDLNGNVASIYIEKIAESI